jgi:hypothetical protein
MNNQDKPAYPISEEETDRIDTGVTIYSGLTKLEAFTKDIVAKMEWHTPYYSSPNDPRSTTIINSDLSPVELAQIVKAVKIAKATLAELEKQNGK